MSQTVDFLMDFRNFVLPLAESVHQLRQNVDREPEGMHGSNYSLRVSVILFYHWLHPTKVYLFDLIYLV